MNQIVPATWALGGALFMTTLVAMHASSVGWGVTQPEKNPPSIREGSMRGRSGPYHRSRYFMGGGLRGGK